MNPVEVLQLGAVELASILGAHGFEFVHTSAGPSSGGAFASGEFRRGDRRLELHFRGSLGMVRYHVGPDSLRHDDFTRAVLATTGARESPRYPGFSDDPLDGFRHLAQDLSRFGEAFMSGTTGEFGVLVRWVEGHPRRRGFGALK